MAFNRDYPIGGPPPYPGYPLPIQGQALPFVPPVQFQAAKDTLTLSGRQKQDSSECQGETKQKDWKSFIQGLVSPIVKPIQMMSSSFQNFLIGGSLLGVGAYLLTRYGKVLSPFLVAGGMALGTYQGVNGIQKLSEADTPEERQKAFHDLGSATANIGLASLGLEKVQKFLPGKWLAGLGPMHEPLHLLQGGSLVGSQKDAH